MREATAAAGRDRLASGAIAGLVGAAVLAVWFLLVDGLAGQPFHTPAFLYRVLFGGEELQLVGAQVALYSVVHFGVFIAVGMIAAWAADRLPAAPGILAGAILGFVLFDLLFYGSVWLTGVDVVGYLGWAEVLVGNVLAGIALFGTLRLMDPEQNLTWNAVLSEYRVLREGVVVGLVGAVAVAVWFLVLDTVAGRILFTPAALGSIVFHGATGPDAVQMEALTILGYTGFHLVAFLLTGVVAAGIAAAAEDREPYFLFGGVLLFVSFETFFIGMVAIAAQWLLAVIPWWSIVVANLIAAASMGYYLWSRHPELVAALGEADLERVRDQGVAREPGEAGLSPPAGGSTGGGSDRS